MWSKTETLFASLGVKRNHYRFPRFAGKPSAFSCVTTRAVIHNTTLYDIPPVITVYDSVIPVHVTNAKTGAFLKFKIPTGKNHRLVADIKNATAILEENTGDKWVYKENVIHCLTLDSRLTDFIVAPGDNEFKIDASAGENPVLIVTANEPVMGV